jgi:tetratricopeptide (TPR) repeat protein
MNKATILSIIFCCLVQACASVDRHASTAITADSGVIGARALIGPQWPQNTSTRLTTSGDIYLANLDSQIAALEQLASRRPSDHFGAQLALAYYHRFQIMGQLHDAEQARSVLQAAAQREHTQIVDLTHVQVLLGFHEFELANATLDCARQHGGNDETVDELQMAVNRATGTNTAPDSLDPSSPGTNPTPVVLVTQAADLLERGNAAAASRLLKSAQDRYLDTAPYLLAWIQVQQGIVFLRHRDYAAAATFFGAAHDRFPQFALATEHLAETQLALGNYRLGADLYRSVSEQTGNPEFYYRLAMAERALGMHHQAAIHEQRAQSGYADLMARYPFMYADHAARYFLATSQAETALDLAQQNMLRRQDIRARTLLLETELAVGRADAACDEFKTIRSLGYEPPELAQWTGDLAAKCSL